MTDAPFNAQCCPACGAANHCAIAQGAEQCWCMSEPIESMPPASDNASCYCRACLRKRIAAKDSASAIDTPQLHKPVIPR